MKNNSKKKQNVILIVIDDMGWKDLNVCGSTFYESPNIDRLMNDGVRLSNAYASCPVCSPSRASLMSGKYPATIGVTDWIDAMGTYHPLKGKLIDAPYIKYLPLSEKSIASTLKDHGYQTYHVGKWHLGSEKYYPEHQGFLENKGGCFWGHPFNGYFSPYGIPTLQDGPDGEYLTDRLTDEAMNLIDKAGEKPFFLYLSHYTVHIPVEAPIDLVKKFEEKAKRLGLDKINPIVANGYSPVLEGKAEEINKRVVQSDPTYAAMIYNLDQNIGRLVEKLERDEKLEDTLIIFTSDNGGLSSSQGSPTCNYPAAEGKGWMYDGGIRVPLSFTWKNHLQKGKICEVPTSSPDIYPTILEALNLPLLEEQHADGKSIFSVLECDDIPINLINRDLFWHYPHYGNQGGCPASAIREGDWKLIEFFEDMHIELYNIKEDVSESFELSEKYKDKTDDLREKLNVWRKSIDAKIPKKNPNWISIE
jgi:arylsulfatase A-like enzyme